MCGINGIISSDPGRRDEEILHHKILSMNDTILHRGPDASDLWIGEGVALGHVRLSIQDLSDRSNQPMLKDNYIIVFNGEVYNFKELKSELSDVRFDTTSDTEVVLEMWRKFGPDCLNKLRGMFAFSIHELHTGNTFVVRDHFGIKPLFYAVTDEGFSFSSELKALESCFDTKLSLSNDAIAASLAYVWIDDEHCIYEQVRKLGAGTYLKIDSNFSIEKVTYWSSRSLISKPPKISDETTAIKALSTALEDSVAAHMVSDVPVNAFLSGGLDSSLLVSMAKEHVDNLDCYTIRFSDEAKKFEAMADDAYYAEKVAKKLGVTLNTIEVQPNLVELLPKIVHHLDEPIGDSAAINTYIICDAARKNGVKVLLSGMGADEMFAGYRKHYANALACRYRQVPAVLRAGFEGVLSRFNVASDSGGSKLIRWAKRFTSFAGMEDSDSFLRSYTYYDLAEIEDSFITERPDVNRIRAHHHSLFEYGKYHRDFVDAMCFTDINHFMVGLNLAYSDRASMAASTEVRVPFIDRVVLETAFDIASSLKLKGSSQKYILKKTAEKWLPHEVIYRPKASFSMPLRAWIKHDLSDLVDEYLLSSNGLVARGILKPSFIKGLVDAEFSGKEDNAQKIWHLLTLEQWLRNKSI